MALCRAVIPSSLAALGLDTYTHTQSSLFIEGIPGLKISTSRAVFLTSSSSPSNEASSNKAKGSKLTRRDFRKASVAPLFRLPLRKRRAMPSRGGDGSLVSVSKDVAPLSLSSSSQADVG